MFFYNREPLEELSLPHEIRAYKILEEKSYYHFAPCRLYCPHFEAPSPTTLAALTYFHIPLETILDLLHQHIHHHPLYCSACKRSLPHVCCGGRTKCKCSFHPDALWFEVKNSTFHLAYTGQFSNNSAYVAFRVTPFNQEVTILKHKDYSKPYWARKQYPKDILNQLFKDPVRTAFRSHPYRAITSYIYLIDFKPTPIRAIPKK